MTEFEIEKVSEIERKLKETKNYCKSFKVESFCNTLIYILKGVAACYLPLYLILEVMNDWLSTNDTVPLHVFLTAVEYQLFIADAISECYAPNSWSYFLLYKTILRIAGYIHISVIRKHLTSPLHMQSKVYINIMSTFDYNLLMEIVLKV